MATDNPTRLLVVDDKANIRQLLADTFEGRGFDVTTASNGDEAVALFEEEIFDAVITDLRMPGRDGIGVLRAAKHASVDMGVIVVTAYGTMETAVEAMRLGAFDFVAKPFKLEEIERKVDKMLAHQAAQASSVPGQGLAPKATPSAPAGIVGSSDSTRQVLDMVAKIGPSKSSVLITGPSGTGKELIARAIHESSPRNDKPFVALNCAALAPGVLESELFGHEKGAFTGAAGLRVGRFEKAHTGTLFLDEVGEIDPNIQTKLLRVLQENEIERVGGATPLQVDVRVIAATNRDLREAIQQGGFREDFFYRLNVFSLQLERLANRRDDIPPLIDHFLRKFSEETGKEVTAITDEVRTLFLQYPWPGNIRELENVLERAVVLSTGSTIGRDEIPPDMFHFDAAAAAAQASPAMDSAGFAGSGSVAPPSTLGDTLPQAQSLTDHVDRIECETIARALEKFRWNKTKAAEHLGIKRTTLQYKIKKYGLE